MVDHCATRPFSSSSIIYTHGKWPSSEWHTANSLRPVCLAQWVRSVSIHGVLLRAERAHWPHYMASNNFQLMLLYFLELITEGRQHLQVIYRNAGQLVGAKTAQTAPCLCKVCQPNQLLSPPARASYRSLEVYELILQNNSCSNT